ncbi:MAG: RNA methyltransferase [Proteobacteria bacterium]|nr:RNA methyltransferase [Pseudomonadota bacterium]
MELIRSSQNKSIQRVQRLIKSRSARRDAGFLVLDGIHLVEECVRYNYLEKLQVFVEDPITSKEISLLIQEASEEVTITLVESHIFKKLSTTKSSQGIVAIGRLKQKSLSIKEVKFALAIDGIQDPGNLGSILRSAAAFSVDTVYLSAGTVDAYSPKSLRGGMGAQFRLAIIEDSDLSSVISEFPGRSIGSSSLRGEAIERINFSGPLLLLIGSEGTGLSDILLDKVDDIVSIPLANNVESLNVGSAAAILCFYKANLIK